MSEGTGPLFITGYMRSGTTLLGNMVDRHPDISVFVESFFIPRYYYSQPVFWPLSRHANRVRLAQAIISEPRSAANGVAVDVDAVAAEAEPSLSGVLDSVMSRWAESRGAPRWGDKSPGYLTKLPILHRLFPESRVVHIYRDGRDVMVSIRSLVKWRDWDTNAARIARGWERAMHQARRWGARHPDRYLEVQYEQLIADPAPVIQRVAEFAGLPYDPVMLESTEDRDLNPALATWERVNARINPGNLAKWRTKASPEDVATFEYLAGETLERFGYERSGHALGASGRRQARLDLLSGYLARPAQFARRGGRFVLGTLRPGNREDTGLS